MDPEVTCPRCQQRQALPSPDGYRCTSCGARWVFVTCRSCHGRFHMGPATRSWVCPTCGVRNGPAGAGAEAAAGTAGAAPATAAPTPTSRRRKRSPFSGSERLPLIVVVVAAVLVIALIWTLFGRNKGTTNPGSPSPSGSLTAAQGLAKLCNDIPIDQNLRVDALNREADLVRVDAEAIKKAGDRPTSRKAVAVAVAMENLATALGSQGDASAATAQLHTAVDAVSALCQAG